MADTAKRRADSGSDQRREQYYIDGNAVRKLQTAPEKRRSGQKGRLAMKHERTERRRCV